MKYFFYIITLIILVNCQEIDKNRIPETLLSEEEMSLVLMDVILLKNIRSNYFENLKNTGITPSEYLCAKYDVDSIMLQENMGYYSYEPSRLKKIYEKVSDSLEKSHEQIDVFIKSRKDIEKKEDSIQKTKEDTKKNPMKNKTRY